MRNQRKIVIGTLVAAMAALSLHIARADTVPHWELHMFIDVDGVRKVSTPLLDKPFFDPIECIRAGLLLAPPPPSKIVDGKTYSSGYTCIRVDAPAITT